MLDPEEILLDKRAEEMGENQLVKLDWPLPSIFIKSLFVFCFMLMTVIFLRTFYLQAIKGAYYSDLADNNKTRHYVINAPRGIIYDRYGEPLVLNSPSYSLTMVPLDLPRDSNERAELIEQVALIFNFYPEDIARSLQTEGSLASMEPILLKPKLEVEEIRKFEANIGSSRGFIIASDTSRYYPYKEAMAQVVGYVGKMSDQDRETYPNYPLISMVGKDGLEAYYEDLVQGQWGRRLVEVDAYGRLKQDLGTISPQAGNDLTVTLDKDLQIQFYESLEKQLRNLGVTAGAGIALDPKTGEILALVNLPSFDPNVLVKGSPASLIDEYLSSRHSPLFNRAISGLYPPGSLIKPLMAVAALEEKTIDPLKNIYDEGQIVITSPYDPNEKYTFHDWEPHGWVDMRKAIAVSCNVYFWAVGGGYEDVAGLGLAKIKKYWNLFHLGNLQGIDLGDESVGVLPDQAWLKATRPDDPTWKLGDTYNISIGEGGLSLTPLQMIDYISIIANNGVLMQPHLKKDAEPVQLVKLNLSLDNLKIVQEGMRQVVTRGTATVLNNLPMPVAGKSGSPKFISLGQTKYHAFFGAYAPYDDPQIVILVLIEQPPQGSVATLPVVKEILDWYYQNRINNAFQALSQTQ